MKKYFVFLGIAAMTLAACTKTETIEAPAQKIDFQVASYVPQTRANSSLDSEGYESFKTEAYYFPTTGAPQYYMQGVDVVKGTDAWAPVQDYYWPKKGHINFYSYIGTKNPTLVYSDDKKTVTATYNTTIADNDNFLIADPALHFSQNVDQVTVDKDLVKPNEFDYKDGVYKAADSEPKQYQGVPTLFHHQLAKIAVIVKLKTTKKSSNTWKVDILDTDANPSKIFPVNKGVLTLENVDTTTTATKSLWTYKNTDDQTIGWVPSTIATDVDKISLARTGLTLEPNALESAQDSIVVAVRTVMPQLTNGVEFNFSYQVTANNGTSDYMTEINKFNETDTPKYLSDAVSSITKWEMNKVYIYKIYIDPVTDKITFDPAVVEWEPAVTGTLSFPL